MLPLAVHLLLATAPANPLDPPDIGLPVKLVVSGIVGLLMVGVLVLTFVKLWMDVLGKRVATVSIQAHSENDPKDSGQTKAAVIDVTGFVAVKDFDNHKEEVRLRTLGLEKQISQLRHDWKEDLAGYAALSRDREETTGEALEGINAKMGANAERLAKVETAAELILRTLSNLEAKVDRHNERRAPASA